MATGVAQARVDLARVAVAREELDDPAIGPSRQRWYCDDASWYMTSSSKMIQSLETMCGSKHPTTAREFS